MQRDKILAFLLDNQDCYISGEDIAAKLGISRTAVWKNIKVLKAQGYEIDSVSNRGYCLRARSNVLSESGIARYIKTTGLNIKVFESVTSTNTLLKTLAAEGAPEGTVIIARDQTAGRGRLGRSFYSPSGTGIYFSILLRPSVPAEKALKITAGAAVAAAKAIEDISGSKTQIKWVNDIVIDGKKVCGILTEASIDCESGMMNYAIVGIGINTRTPDGGFPEEIRDVAGAVFEDEAVPELHCRLAAGVIDSFFNFYGEQNSETAYAEYISRSSVIGKQVNLIPYGGEPESAFILDIDQDFALIAKMDNGMIKRVNSGEVSLRFTE